MESPNAMFALYGGTNECAKTNTRVTPISEVKTGVFSLKGKTPNSKYMKTLIGLLEHKICISSPLSNLLILSL